MGGLDFTGLDCVTMEANGGDATGLVECVGDIEGDIVDEAGGTDKLSLVGEEGGGAGDST